MASYSNFNFNKKKRNSKGKIAVITTLIVLAVIFIIGITVGSDETEYISSAVKENTQLKQQISELNDQISQLNEEIASLNAELAARPTIEPTPYEAMGVIMPTDEPEATISPRTGIRP